MSLGNRAKFQKIPHIKCILAKYCGVWPKMYLLFLILGVQVPSLGSEVDHLQLLLGLLSLSLSDPGLVHQNRPRPLPSTSFKIQYYLFILSFEATNHSA